MRKIALWSAITAMVLTRASYSGAGTALQGVPNAPGGFEREGGPAAIMVRGEPLGVAKVESLAGTSGGYDLLVDGASIFGMDYAHRVGRREPLRPLAADLSDWQKAPECPPDRILIDPRAGRIRFFGGHDAAKFRSQIVARFRGTHGDAAIAQWRGNVLLLSHWESAFHVWAYDVSDPSAPRKIGELPVANFAHGFVVLDSGWGLMGTTDPRGIFLLDLRDPRRMKVAKAVVPGHDWLGPLTPRYLAVWRQAGKADDQGEPRVFDASRLPDEFPEVTADVKTEVRQYLAGRVDAAGPEGRAWFRLGDESLAEIDLRGEPAAWRITRTIKLPELPAPQPSDPKARRPDARIVVETLVPGKRFVLLFPAGDFAQERGAMGRLQVLDVSLGQVKFFPAVNVEPTASQFSALGGKYAYLSVPPRNRGSGVVGTWEGTYLSIYDLSDPASVRQVGTWDPGFPTRNMQLIPQPDRKTLVLVKEECTGMGIHFADFSDPLRPKVLSSIATNGEGNRVAAWGDKAVYASSTLAQCFDLSNPLAPKRTSTWLEPPLVPGPARLRRPCGGKHGPTNGDHRLQRRPAPANGGQCAFQRRLGHASL